jgi:hypothetical protein
LGDFGANQVHFGSKTGTPKLHKTRYRIIRVLRINAYFTVLNVSEVRMTYPWYIRYLKKQYTVLANPSHFTCHCAINERTQASAGAPGHVDTAASVLLGLYTLVQFFC